MKRLIVAALLLPSLAFAAAPAAKPAMDPARMEKMEKRLRTFRTIGLAQALDLDAARALQLDAVMAPFDERRKPLHEQLKQSKEVLERAADGDPAAANQVDQAIEQAYQARAQLEQLDRDMLAQVSKGMNPQQKAKLAVFLVTFKHEMMRRFGHGGGMHGMRGMHPGGPGGGPGAQGGGDDEP